MCFLSSLSINGSRVGEGTPKGFGGAPDCALFVLEAANMAFCFCVFFGALGGMATVVFGCRDVFLRVNEGIGKYLRGNYFWTLRGTPLHNSVTGIITG